MKQYVLVPRDTLQAHYNTLEAYCGYTDEEVTELRNLLAAPCEPVAWLACDSEGDSGLGFKETHALRHCTAGTVAQPLYAPPKEPT